jgi:5-methylcytosine-specific restriction endonuclease McrA
MRYKDITGQKFNRLQAIKYLFTDKNRQAVWLWKCNCGNIIEKTGNTVKTNKTKSCGCLNNELIKSRKFLSFKGRQHTEKTKQILRNKLKGYKRKIQSIKKGSDKLKGRKYSIEHRIALSKGWTNQLRKWKSELQSSLKEKNPLYKDGKWKERASQREIDMNTEKYISWRRKIFEGDNYTCQICGIQGLKLQADHIKSYTNFPELRYDIDNGRTLCINCHKKTDNYGGRLNTREKELTKLQGLGLLT